MGNSESRSDRKAPQKIEEDLHSRQLAVYGRETMRYLLACNVLISGLNGLGIETAKNLVLVGVKSNTLHDVATVDTWELSSNFFFTKDDMDKNRAVACVQKLRELNSAVLVSTLTEELKEEHLANFQAVVFTGIRLDQAIKFNEYCRTHQPPISFIKSEIRGPFGGVFCNFGPEFRVIDTNAKEPHTSIITSISNDKPALVTYLEGDLFIEGEFVSFSEVEGMIELNDGKLRKVLHAGPGFFCLDENTMNFGVYKKGGIVAQVKEPTIVKFKSLRDALRRPINWGNSCNHSKCNDTNCERGAITHLALLALDKFLCDFGRYPLAGSEADAQKFVKTTQILNEAACEGAKVREINMNVFKKFASGARAVLNPMAAIFGGIVGQEVLKACLGIFYPIFQFFYFDSLESLPVYALDPDEMKPINSRHDAQISVFGYKIQQKLRESKVFMVGSGALGCEVLKNLALMGVACSSAGKVIVTNDQVIDKSNLTSEFLFTDLDIGNKKSLVASLAAVSINPDLHIYGVDYNKCSDIYSIVDKSFWEGLDVVVKTLNNGSRRMDEDMEGLYYSRTLLESNIYGLRCNTDVVIPHLTENYGVLIHSFLTWARSEFEGLLEKTPNEVNSFLKNPGEYAATMRKAGDAQEKDLLERIAECLDNKRCETFQDCVTWARLKFEDYFVNRVKQLTYTFPEDSSTSTGAPFWSAPKHFPRPLQFSSSNKSHLNFIMAASILRAETFGITIPNWAKNTEKLANTVNKVIVPEFQPKKGVKIETDEKATNMSNASIDDSAMINDLLAKLDECAKKLPSGFKMKPIQFEEDDDTNYHIDMIAGLANMRARNYSIPEVDKLEAKFIAGRIIPTIATTTAIASGLVCLELYKVISGDHPLEDYSNSCANLALPLFYTTEPAPLVPYKWTISRNVICQSFLSG